jgi:hypothetical protein
MPNWFASEEQPVKTLIHTCLSQSCQAEVPKAFGDTGFCLEHYVADATQRLDAAKDSLGSGRGVEDQKLDWLLAQVDFVVELIGDESLAPTEAQRSKLLELLLGIANLNEHIRRSTAQARQGH